MSNAEEIEEKWEDVPWAPTYQVSTRGRVYSKGYDKPRKGGGRFRRGPRILKQSDNGVGYPVVAIPDKEGRMRTMRVSKLVAEVFLGSPPDGKPFVLHNNGDTYNNSLSNLRWGSPADNMQDRILHGNNPERRKTHCPKGHEYTPENTALYGEKNHRSCRTCKNNKARIRRSKGLPKGDKRHGTRTGYTAYGCRCSDCREANSNWGKANRESRAGERTRCEVCGTLISTPNLERHKKSRNCKPTRIMNEEEQDGY